MTALAAPEIHPALADLAFVDAKAMALAARISLGQFYAEMREGHVPEPAIRRHRFSRWRVADARAWLVGRAGREGVTT